jgi:DNA polymerase epsilon subunit 2
MSSALPSVEDIEDVSEQISPPPGQSPTTDTNGDSYAIQQAKKLILTLLPQSTLSPFPLSTRPVHWDYASSALSLYPLPHTLILADPEMEAFAVTFEGCHCVNPGKLVDARVGGRREVRWVEYDLLTKRGVIRAEWVG